MGSKCCLCNLCKGQAFFSRYKVKQHLKLYGFYEPKRPRVCDSDSSEGEPDNQCKDSRDGDAANQDEIYHLHNHGVVSCGEPSDSDGSNQEMDKDPIGPDIGKTLTEVTEQGIDQYLEDSIPVFESDDGSDTCSDYSSSSSESESEDGIASVVDAFKDVSDVNAEILTGQEHDIDEAIAKSPPVHSSLKCTLLETIIYLFDWFSSHPSLSKEAFSNNLQLWHSILPEGNLLPTNYQQAYRIIKPFLVSEIVFHACANDCVLFRGEYHDSLVCPKCKEPRFKRKNIPRRTFHYLPLGPRLVRSYGVEGISYMLQNHGGDSSQPNKKKIMRDIHDSPKWKHAFSKSGTFNGDLRGVALSLCLDGLNPWSKNKANHSMWPIVLGQLNLPRNIRYRFENLFLVGIIPSQIQGKEPYNLNPFLEVLIDEIIFLSSCKLYDAYRKAPFQAKVKVMIYVLDYPGVGKVFSLTTSGSYRACAWCLLRGQYCEHLKKVVYAGNRRYLPDDNNLRKDCCHFPDKSEELRKQPPPRKFEQDVSFHKAYDNGRNNSRKKKIATGTGCNGMYILASKLPGFDRVEQSMPDAMHTIAVQIKHLVRCIAGKAPEDSLAVRMEEKSLGRFEEAWPTNNGNSSLPSAPFVLTKRQMEEADRRVAEIKVPFGDNFCPRPIFSRLSRMNSHELKEIATRGILKYVVRGMFPQTQQKTLNLFLNVIAAICAPWQDASQISGLKEQVRVALAHFERDFPLSLQVITNHLLHHIVDGIEKFGPVHGTWMFAYERFNSWLCRRALSRQHPESTILRTYQIFEWCRFIKSSGKMKNKLPFKLSYEDEDPQLPQQSPPLPGEVHLSDIDLALMNEVYKKNVSELQSLCCVYEMEKTMARKQRKLKSFPSLNHWCPKAFTLSEPQALLLKGPQPTASIYHEFLLESKEHSCSYLYASSHHSSKSATFVCYLLPQSSVRFGIIESIYRHSFGSKEYMWASVQFYTKALVDSPDGVWYTTEDSLSRSTTPVLLSYLSHPLTTAVDKDKKIWFLDPGNISTAT